MFSRGEEVKTSVSLLVSATSLVEFSQTAVTSPNVLLATHVLLFWLPFPRFVLLALTSVSRLVLPASRFLCLDFFGSRLPHSTSLAFSRLCDLHAVSNLPRHNECGGFSPSFVASYFEDVFLRPYRSPTLIVSRVIKGFMCPSLAVRPPRS